MPYLTSFLSVLIVFLFMPVQGLAKCSKDNIIPNEFLVVISGEINKNFAMTPTGLSTKTHGSSSFREAHLIKKISKNSRVRRLSLSKTGSQSSTLQTYLIAADSLEAAQKKFPNGKIQHNCKVEFLQTVQEETDPLHSFQKWYFDSINQTNSSSLIPLRDIVVAVSDTGVDIDHSDLNGNLWQNQAELNGVQNVDDDGNGYVDDVYGYDFGDDDSNPKPTFSDNFLDYDHGTHVAGLISARSLNSIGVSGVSLNSVKVMSLKGFKSNAPSSISDLLETIYYAVDNGADVINASWGSEKLAEAAEVAAINYAVENNVVVVAAAGNDRVPASWFVPASIKNVVTVASINSNDELSTFSNYGSSVDFIAPGGDGPERSSENLLSLGLGSSYLELKGTSMAAPIVSGLIGALMSQDLTISPYQAVHVLKQSSSQHSLQPFSQTNDLRAYYKPNFEAALNFLENNKNLPEIKPEIEDVNSFSQDLASKSKKGGGGCSNSLSSQSYQEGSNLQSRVSFFSLLLILMPLLVVAWTAIKLRFIKT